MRMDLSTLVNIASVLSSLAVLVLLAYLAWQLRHGALNLRSKVDPSRSQQVGDRAPKITKSDARIRAHSGNILVTASRRISPHSSTA